ncbi:hypothetical protein PRIPAC_90731 [Pristionchus pacificus]|uniref:Uncharacterized protein n=1 Tax=Pristionchus pacificus TaxID=54126 RepID=A0A2A6CZP5_PRIPA|nr:hypothetical protein PRIPAC_90731 [Pristionchus pacificus]|eukprot:PDM83501.1 hypothetical protein PRIPAC_35133 [Pristionchus pacificus]
MICIQGNMTSRSSSLHSSFIRSLRVVVAVFLFNNGWNHDDFPPLSLLIHVRGQQQRMIFHPFVDIRRAAVAAAIARGMEESDRRGAPPRRPRPDSIDFREEEVVAAGIGAQRAAQAAAANRRIIAQGQVARDGDALCTTTEKDRERSALATVGSFSVPFQNVVQDDNVEREADGELNNVKNTADRSLLKGGTCDLTVQSDATPSVVLAVEQEPNIVDIPTVPQLTPVQLIDIEMSTIAEALFDFFTRRAIARERNERFHEEFLFEEAMHWRVKKIVIYIGAEHL